MNLAGGRRGPNPRETAPWPGRRSLVRPGDLVDDVRIVDRASTNGTLLEAPDGSLVRCRPWQVTFVRAPSTIHLGRTRLHVRTAATRRLLEVA